MNKKDIKDIKDKRDNNTKDGDIPNTKSSSSLSQQTNHQILNPIE